MRKKLYLHCLRSGNCLTVIKVSNFSDRFFLYGQALEAWWEKSVALKFNLSRLAVKMVSQG